MTQALVLVAAAAATYIACRVVTRQYRRIRSRYVWRNAIPLKRMLRRYNEAIDRWLRMDAEDV